ncbi:hypothetical protein Tco_0322053 [Tanacetum coccineum]
MLRKCHGHGLTKGAIIQIFYHGLDEPTQGILDGTAGGVFLYKTPSQAFQLLEDKKSLTELNRDVRNDLEDFKSCIRSMRIFHDKLFDRDDQSKTDLKKSITKFLDGQRVLNMYIKNNVNDMIIKMKQNEKNFQTKIKNMERKMDEWSKSQNLSSEQTDRTEPPHPPQAQTEHVNVVFTGSGKSDDPSKTLKDPPPPIIVNNKIEKDRPIKISKKGYHVVKIKEYPFCEYISKISYPQAFKVDHSHLNHVVKET